VKRSVRPRLSYSNVIATIALFVALGGAAVAAGGLPRHSVGARQLRRGAVTSAALRKHAVTMRKIASNSVFTQMIADGAVNSTKLSVNAVSGAAIANGAIGTGKLAINAVTPSKIADGAVTLSKIGNEVGPLLGTLRSGQTLRGVFTLGTEAKDSADFTSDGVDFYFPLSSTPAVNPPLAAGSATANCPGTPNASPGNLCVYVSAQTGEAGSLEIENPSRLGFGLRANAKAAGAYSSAGFWAVTAP
jgi:hypothetical protein